MLSTISAPPSARAEAIIKKRAADGTMSFSDTQLNTKGQRIAYQGQYGRPTATASCKGQTEQSLTKRRDELLPLFLLAAHSSGVKLSLLTAVARVESCFDPKARSSAGAMGVMQLMPATAAELGVWDAHDAASNIKGGAHYLQQMLALHNNDIELALAAYNAGPGAVAKYGGIPPYPETQRYVVLVKKQLARNQDNL